MDPYAMYVAVLTLNCVVPLVWKKREIRLWAGNEKEEFWALLLSAMICGAVFVISIIVFEGILETLRWSETLASPLWKAARLSLVGSLLNFGFVATGGAYLRHAQNQHKTNRAAI